LNIPYHIHSDDVSWFDEFIFLLKAPGPDGGGRCPGVYHKAETGKDRIGAERLISPERDSGTLYPQKRITVW